MAQLGLLAGRKAVAASTFQTASLHLRLSINLLGDSGWEGHYDLTLACHNAAAEISLLVLDAPSAFVLIESVRNNARDDLDLLQAETIRVYALGMSDWQNEAIALAIDLLHFGRNCKS